MLGDHAVVGFREPVTRAPGACWLAANTRPENVVLACDSVAAVANAVRAGLGLSALPCFVLPDYPTLVRLTPAVVACGDVFVVIPPTTVTRPGCGWSSTRWSRSSSTNVRCSKGRADEHVSCR